MTNQEAINHLKTWTDANEKALNNPHVSELLKSEIELDVDAMRMAIAALEKQEPMETPCINPVNIKAFDGIDSVVTYKCVPCPVCGKWLSIHGAQKNYCEFCGQAVKLKEGEKPWPTVKSNHRTLIR